MVWVVNDGAGGQDWCSTCQSDQPLARGRHVVGRCPHFQGVIMNTARGTGWQLFICAGCSERKSDHDLIRLWRRHFGPQPRCMPKRAG
jgi:hypothetical protein